MTKLLIKIFVKDSENVKSIKVRERYGVLSGIVGIACNLILFLSKIVIGTISGSIAISADAFNNLADLGSNAVSVFGFKMSARPADKEHPFGHGRYEYIASFIVSLLILLVGFELLTSSVPKIFSPEPVKLSIALVIVLIISILIKLWMSVFFKHLSFKINSSVMKASSIDSRNDVLMTAGVLISVIISHYTGFNLDGWIGAVLAVFIFVSGLKMAKEMLDPILGQAPSSETVNEIKDTVLKYDGIIGIHDMVVHNYGEGRMIATLHAEVSANEDILDSHDLIDSIERDIKNQMNIDLVIHMDPIVMDDEKVNSMRVMVQELVVEVDSELSIHDFRMVEGTTHTNLIFDVVIPFGMKKTDEEILEEIEKEVKKIDENYYTVITIDHSFVQQ